VADGKKNHWKTNAAMSVYYNQDITNKREKDKRHHDLIAALREGPTDWGLHPELATMVDRKDISRECLRSTVWETAPPPTRTLPSLQR
jgi:hypothetical protein